MSLTLPPIEKKIVSSRLLTGGPVEVNQTDEEMTITVPPEHRHDIDTIVELRLDGPASEIPPCSTDQLRR